MTEYRKNLIVGERKGIPFYRVNPSIPTSDELRIRSKMKQVATGGQAMIVHPDSGEILGKASVAFMQSEEVDQQKFVKLYINGIKSMTGLTSSGAALLELIVTQLHERPDSDQVYLSAFDASEHGLKERTYHRALQEILSKNIIFASSITGVFFINIQYLFNGNRLHFVKSFYKAGTKKNENQGTLDWE